MVSQVKDLLEQYLNLQKIRTDYSNYLVDSENNLVNQLIEVYNFDREIFESIQLLLSDTVTIIRFDFSYECDLGYTINVIIALGGLKRNNEAVGLYTVGKCIAKMRYNEDLEIFNIEFYK